MARKDNAPPLPPEVTQQQQDPAAQYAAQHAAAAGGPGAAPGTGAPNPQAGMQFAKSKLASISNDLLELAKVIAVESPQLMPILNRMAMMGAQLDKLMAQGAQGQSGPSHSAANGAEPPQGSMSAPEAPGAMGM